MDIILQKNVTEDMLSEMKRELTSQKISGEWIEVEGQLTFHVQKDNTSKPNFWRLKTYVDRVIEDAGSYPKASRSNHLELSHVQVGSTLIGPGHLTVIAGPCAVEDEEQVMKTAFAVKAAGATHLRGGVFKPRTSPYAFQGLGLEGLAILKRAKEATGLPIVSELMSTATAEMDAFVEEVDLIQIGARNMQNFALLKELGKINKPILLKRGLSATYMEWLMAAEYIMAHGNPNVILCERGIRTYETETRNTLDIQAVPVLREKTHLPILIDPSHAAGRRSYIKATSKAAIAAGADGLIIEVHPEPEKAMSDKDQALTLEAFADLMKSVKVIADLEGRK
ncbi:3-deoxy-7-phosphoheptulonate synthase [Atopobacter sp. AH10]|uniref:3-deoxy-7-phosphoheptulonate synthase n=1 Tax=Atopobacter sp. AH10 TaxID=2315861 RepID=UPI000EF25AA9|nr:3-deoxy-7-phosphoheptulonate synthase [Atopobacter sp. AH10]RLK64156.1 3-deoxy-7-phosphoheptulonate synthase [Atopobacter sp. AH10]